ncbi:LA_2272 family surface repeat-containing protein [Puniceicoccus vermicola]|uniref:PhaC PHA synthase n=1 Tax=Puniceicoccus vermicola TaxID=388746 RepID=A0A7X1E4U9_9BACT|nr:hypothetical protein [Puniceicoccus vermicola]MBC2600982.1 hypothetical protein [Puniceicoccus vermicola]
MKKSLLALATILTAFGMNAQAQEGPTRAIELSVWSPIQLGDATDSVKGVRLNIFYAKNDDLTGLDLGLFGLGYNTGDVKGVQLNFIGSVVEGDMSGWQTGIYTHTKGEFRGLKGGLINLQGDDFYGWQAGAITLADAKVAGLQTGLFNKAGDMRGLQLGLVNYSEKLYGVQIGLANINVEADPLYFFPFVNASF